MRTSLSKFWGDLFISSIVSLVARGFHRRFAVRGARQRHMRWTRPCLGSWLKHEWNHPQILRGSFSAVSTATIARVGAFCRIRRDLQDLQSFAPLRSRNFSKNQQTFDANLWNFRYKNGAKECKSCRSRKMQKNASFDSFLAIVAVHTAENEPSQV